METSTLENKPSELAAEVTRRLPIGAELQPGGGVHFRVWAPRSRSVEVLVSPSAERDEEKEAWPMTAEGDGYFSALVGHCKDGACYRFRLETGEYPDPASRFQPRGPHGPSQVIDSRKFQWTDREWGGVRRSGQVIYEMHVGTFTREGTYSAAKAQLAELARAGITLIELMPLAEFSGRFGWGYDGVDLFAPSHLYGHPDELRAFVDEAHRIGLGVILDVVYNHFGPDGCYLREFSKDYISKKYANEWGEAINFDGEQSGPVREFFSSNAVYWIEEFHFDGFRFDATQQIFDSSPDHILAMITRKSRDAARGRPIFMAAENEPQHAQLVRPSQEGGYGLDAVWNDDFHHAAMVATTGHAEAYFTDYKGSPQEFISAMKWGYLYQGQWYDWQQKRRGTPTFGLHPSQFVSFLQNHDQVANSLRGERIHQLASPGMFRALTALLLLGPGTPLLFQGQEFGASSPFLYFADHNQDLAKLVNAGRREFLHQFPSIASPEALNVIMPAESEQVFELCKLDFSERQKHAAIYKLHQDLLELRNQDPVFNNPQPGCTDGAVLSESLFVLRFFGGGHGDRLLIVNFGRDQRLNPGPEPLLAPLVGHLWRVKWSSENPIYGGGGIIPMDACGEWLIPGKAVVVLVPEFNEAEAMAQSQPRKIRRTA